MDYLYIERVEFASPGSHWYTEATVIFFVYFDTAFNPQSIFDWNKAWLSWKWLDDFVKSPLDVNGQTV